MDPGAGYAPAWSASRAWPPAARLRRVEPLESAIVLIALLVVFSTFRIFLFTAGDEADSSGSLPFQLITLSLCGAGLALMALYGVPRWFPRFVVAIWPLLLLIGVALASTLWSVVPEATFRRAVALILSTSFTAYIVARFRLSDLVPILFLTFAIFLVLGFAAAPIPGVGITPDTHLAGTWRGFTGQKNEFGRVCAIAIGCFVIFRLAGHPLARRWWLPGIAMAGLLLILSDSKTSLLSTLTGMAGAVFLMFLATGRLGRIRVALGLRLAIGTAVVGLAVVSITVLLPLIIQAMGRDLTLTGRENLWEYVLLRYPEFAPWGAGFRGFWSDKNLILFFEHFWWRPIDDSKAPNHSHNSYLDLLAELGIPGIAAGLVLLVHSFWTAIRTFRVGARGEALLFGYALSFILLFSYTERGLLQHFDSIWFMFTLSYFYAQRALVEAVGQGPTAIRPPAPGNRSG